MLPTSTDVSVSTKNKIPADIDAIAVFVTEGASKVDAPALDDLDAKAANRLLQAGAHKGKSAEITFDLIEAKRGKFRRVYLVGLGNADKVDEEAIRKAGGALARAAKKHRIASLAIVASADQAAALTTGFLLASFDYAEYRGSSKKKDEQENPPIHLDLTIVTDASAKSAVDRAATIALSQNFARTIASRPGNDINPPSLAKVAQDLAKEVGLTCRVLDEKEMKRLGMGGILAVGAGSSATPPRLIVLEHKPRGAKNKPLLAVGKAITFDTGGISIKPADKMGRMIYDKCGGMAVLGLMAALAQLKSPVHVVGILTSAENHISETAYRPGDIIRMYNGVTVEVTNTDAEGRLVLADALAWGIETYKPAAVVDLATLTGGVIVALGPTMAGVMCNNDALFNEIQTVTQRSGEKIWRLPLADEIREQIKSDAADIVNSAGRNASPLQGSAFLSFFVPTDNSIPWAHFDIAGVAETEKDLPYYGKGSTGWGIRTLVEWAEGRAK